MKQTTFEYNILPKHIKEFEPGVALTDYNDGLIFYRRFSNILNDSLLELISKLSMTFGLKFIGAVSN